MTQQQNNERDEVKFTNTFINANKHKILGDYDQAQVFFERCLKMRKNHAPTHYEMAMIYERKSNLDLALTHAEIAVRSDPKNRWYLQFNAYLLDKVGKNTEAVVLLKELVDWYPNQLEYRYELANNLVFSQAYRDAIYQYDSIEGRAGISEEISVQKHKLYLQLDDEDSAEHELRMLVESDPNNLQYFGRLSDFYKSRSEYTKAAEIYEKLKEKDPENRMIDLSLYEFYRQLGKDEEAERALRKAFDGNQLSVDTKVHVLLSYYTAATSNAVVRKMVIELCHMVVKHHPKAPQSYALLADYQYSDGDVEGAAVSYRSSIQRDSSRYAVWRQLLFVESEIGDFDSMLPDSKAAMELFPSQPIPYLFNGIASLQLDNHENAVVSLEQGKSLVIDDTQLEGQFYANLGDAYYNVKDYQQAYLNYERALKIDPNNTYVLNNYAYYLSLQNEDLNRAVEMIELCIATAGETPSYLDTYAWVLYRMERFEKALEVIENAVLFGGGSNSEILSHKGDILFKLNRIDDAVSVWEKALQLEPESKELKRKINDRTLLD